MTPLEWTLMLEREAFEMSLLAVALDAVDAALTRKVETMPNLWEDAEAFARYSGDQPPCGQGCTCPQCYRDELDELDQIERFEEGDAHDAGADDECE